MKPFAILLLAISFLMSADLKTGYYLTMKDFINNTPTPADFPAQVVNGKDELAAHSFGVSNGEFTEENAYYVEEQENGEFKRVHGKAFKGYCDSGKVYLVDNANPFKGRIMRSAVVGSKYSYFRGIDIQMSGGGFTPGTSVSTPAGTMRMGGGMNTTTSTPVPVLVVINMKTGETTTIKNGLFQKTTMKSLLAPYPDLLKEYKDSKSSGLNMAALYIDKINALPN